ncbi:MAG: molecular chaperone TorD family protein [Bryobacteraceae bacterium]|nr:molecular chaperone TorD family protein [Bryobacteraceae bacterium]
MTHVEEPAGLLAELGRALLRPPDGNPDEEREYVRLFLSPQGAACPPWQSVWPQDGGDPRLMGEAHHSALEWYRRFGFEPATEQEPADHAGLLLIFYAHLLEAASDDEVLTAYAGSHIAWLHHFSTKLEAEARTPRYRQLAVRLKEILTAI